MPTVGIPPERIEHLRLPLDWILVRLDPPTRITRGGIELPDLVMGASRTGVVVSRGEGALSDDGRTKMPMTCERTDRVLFEVGGGKALPLVPRVTTSTEWGYRLIRDGSVCALVDDWTPPDGFREKLPPAPGPVPVSHRGPMDVPEWAGRLRPVQDWLLVRMDERATEHEVRRRPGVPLVGLDGQPLKLQLGPDRDQERREDTWTVEVLRRGPGLNTITRCIDGDRINPMRQFLTRDGARAVAMATSPHAQPIGMDEEWSAPGVILLLREGPCIVAEDVVSAA